MSQLNKIEEAIEELKKGNLIIVVDDEDRENEGDFIGAAELMTPEKVNFMARYGRGLICATLTEERCEELKLDLMVPNNTALHATPFTVSIDLIGDGCSTGISAHDRAKTLVALTNPETKAEDFGRPGHIFPLRARGRGVLDRAGHTEAGCDLTRFAGLYPAGVLVEVMNEDGTMARLPELLEIAKQHDLKIISVADLIKYKLERETLIEVGEKVHMPTSFGDFELIPFKQLSNGMEHVALIKGTWAADEPVLVRVHSSCMTGDIFGSFRCECGEQLHKSMQMIQNEGRGAIVYMNQEGRGIGLMNKIKAYKLQEEGLDTVDANLHLGFKADERDYGIGAAILRELGITRLRLLSNNPIKRVGLEGYGLSVVENVSIEVTPNPHNLFYMKTKKERMGHALSSEKLM